MGKKAKEFKGDAKVSYGEAVILISVEGQKITHTVENDEGGTITDEMNEAIEAVFADIHKDPSSYGIGDPSVNIMYSIAEAVSEVIDDSEIEDWNDNQDDNVN